MSGIRSIFGSQLYPMLPVWTWASNLTSGSFLSKIYKMVNTSLNLGFKRTRRVCRKKVAPSRWFLKKYLRPPLWFKSRLPPRQPHPVPPTLGSALILLLHPSPTLLPQESASYLSPGSLSCPLFLLISHPWLCESSWHMLMFGKPVWNRARSRPNTSLEATDNYFAASFLSVAS